MDSSKKKIFKALLFLLCSFVLIPSFSVAEEISEREEPLSFYEDAKRGYYWYEIQPEESEEEKALQESKDKTIPENKTYEELWNMHPDAFQAYVTQTLKYAVQYPTEENVARHYFTNMIASKKSQAFAGVSALVAQKYPEYSTDQTDPQTTPGRRVVTSMQNSERDNVINNAQTEFALIMFDQSSCKFCESQKGILRFFTNKYGWKVRYLNIEENPELAAMTGIEMSPSIILIRKGEEDFIPVSSGVISMADLTARLYRSIRYLRGEITPEQMGTYQYEKDSPADPLSKLKNRKFGE